MIEKRPTDRTAASIVLPRRNRSALLAFGYPEMSMMGTSILDLGEDSPLLCIVDRASMANLLIRKPEEADLSAC